MYELKEINFEKYIANFLADLTNISYFRRMAYCTF